MRERRFSVTLFLLTFTRERVSQSRACDTHSAVYETCPELRARDATRGGPRAPPARGPPSPSGVRGSNDSITTRLMSGSVDQLICATDCDTVRLFINASREHRSGNVRIIATRLNSRGCYCNLIEVCKRVIPLSESTIAIVTGIHAGCKRRAVNENRWPSRRRETARPRPPPRRRKGSDEERGTASHGGNTPALSAGTVVIVEFFSLRAAAGQDFNLSLSRKDENRFENEPRIYNRSILLLHSSKSRNENMQISLGNRKDENRFENELLHMNVRRTVSPHASPVRRIARVLHVSRRRGTTPSCSSDRHRRRSSYGTRHTDLFYLRGAPGTASTCAGRCSLACLPACLPASLYSLYSSYSQREESLFGSDTRRHVVVVNVVVLLSFSQNHVRTNSQCPGAARYAEYERPTAIIVERDERFPVRLTVQLMNNEEAVARYYYYSTIPACRAFTAANASGRQKERQNKKFLVILSCEKTMTLVRNAK
ncbi:hypothetical protein DBV15_09963 [Temnothorax longispinosus]|uniref:Uncharacterized protein n=1 Tax=Temnothorax longispinosus TaxID=300112 RepID=A0A4S2KFL5_9HYME|nr:hypothetical protein DBV15_09963 [Temnothorax longispinosus]